MVDQLKLVIIFIIFSLIKKIKDKTFSWIYSFFKTELHDKYISKLFSILVGDTEIEEFVHYYLDQC